MPREKGRGLTQSYDKNPYTDRKIHKATWQHKYATKKFDYTTISDRLRTVSWGYDSHPTGVVKPVNGIQRWIEACITATRGLRNYTHINRDLEVNSCSWPKLQGSGSQ